jgi:hypothetical protein
VVALHPLTDDEATGLRSQPGAGNQSDVIVDLRSEKYSGQESIKVLRHRAATEIEWLREQSGETQ